MNSKISSCSQGIILKLAQFTIIVAVFMAFAAQSVFAQIRADAMPKIDKQSQAAIIDSVAQVLNEVYVFPEVAQKMEKLMRKNYKDGTYNPITELIEFTEKLTGDLQSVSHDKHLRVRPLPPRQPGEQTKLTPEEQRKQEYERLRQDNFGFKKLELLPGNIGYVDFRYFADASFSGATVIAAMNFLAHADAIIFDLRQNGGGSPSSIQLISSYLFDEPVHLNSFYIRKTNETKQFWTQPWVEGPKMTKTPVYVLTSGYTFSGAEEFTYNLKNMKRATIIGETTGGGAHPVEGRTFENLQVLVTVPFGRAVNPITKTNWEGTGVTPDIQVPADQALTVARIEAMKKLAAITENEAKKKQYEWALAGLEVEANPVQLDAAALQAYAGVYGPRKFWVENSALFYQREGRPRYKLVPMGNDQFMVAGLDYFRVKFNRDAGGQVNEVVGMYDNGQTDVNQRN